MIYESLINQVNHKSLNSPAYFILEFYCKPNVKLPNCQVTKLLVTKLSSYQIYYVSYESELCSEKQIILKFIIRTIYVGRA